MTTRRGIAFVAFRTIALALPGIEEYISFGTPAFRARGKMLARLREDGVLVLKPVDEVEQRFLMDTQPDAYFLTDHYRGYSAILVRLPAADPAELRRLTEDCWRRLASKKMVAEYDARVGAVKR